MTTYRPEELQAHEDAINITHGPRPSWPGVALAIEAATPLTDGPVVELNEEQEADRQARLDDDAASYLREAE